MKKLVPIFLIVASLLFCPGFVQATTGPRDYVPMDPGTFIFCFYASHTFANTSYSKGDKVTGSLDFNANMAIIRPIYYTQIGPFTIDPQFILPVGESSLAGQTSSGIGDLTLAATIWFLDNREDQYYFGYTPYLTLPTGAYDKNTPANLGANRWATKHEVAFGKGFGPLWLELITNVEFYFENDEGPGLNGQDVDLDKDPQLGVEAHVSYDFTKKFLGSLDYFYAYGGETSLAGVRQQDWANTHTLGATLAYMFTAHTQFQTYFKYDVATYNGLQTGNVGMRLAYIF